ncbi:uncharacterized protein AAGF69_005417 [Amazona ochrocephala]
MSSKNFQGLKEQAEGAAKDAGNTLGRAAEGAVNQITGASQKGRSNGIQIRKQWSNQASSRQCSFPSIPGHSSLKLLGFSDNFWPFVNLIGKYFSIYCLVTPYIYQQTKADTLLVTMSHAWHSPSGFLFTKLVKSMDKTLLLFLRMAWALSDITWRGSKIAKIFLKDTSLNIYSLIIFTPSASIINIKPCCIFSAVQLFLSLSAIDRASKAVQNAVEEATEHAAEDISGLGKICGFEK